MAKSSPGRLKRSRKTPTQSTKRRKSRRPLFRAFLAVSLDGYIADKKGGVEWLNPYFTPEIDFDAFFKTIGATVMGRSTYDWIAEHKYTMEAGMEAYDGDVRKLAAELRRQLAGTGKDICLFGGGISIASFHSPGLVDRWELAVMPVLLGDGIPLFPKHSRGLDRLRLVHSRTLKNGVVELWYEPKR